MNAWVVLEIEPTNNIRLIKKAYAVKLKVTRPDDDPQAYQVLREAFDEAKYLAKTLVFEDVSEELTVVDTEITEVTVPEVTQSKKAAVVVSESSEEVVTLSDKVENNQTDALIDNREEKNQKDNLRAQEIVQSIHDCLDEKGEVVAVKFFFSIINSTELHALDMSKKVDFQMMGYLDWWASQRSENDLTELPLGFMRQVINHYQWHVHDVAMLQQCGELEYCYELIINESGIQFLQKVEQEETDHTYEFPPAARDLLGDFKPFMFRVRAMRAIRRAAVCHLLERVEKMKDGSFDFELNNSTVKWWDETRDKHMFSAWMVGAGLSLGIIVLIVLAELSQFYSVTLSIFSNSIVAFCGYLACSALLAFFAYWVSYACVKLANSFKQFKSNLTGVQLELLLFVAALIASVCAGLFNSYSLADDVFVFMVVFIPMLVFIYRMRVISLVTAFIAVYYLFDVNGVINVFDQVQVYKVVLPVLTVNTALFYGYIDFKAKQLERDFKANDMSLYKTAALELCLVVGCFAYGLIIT